MAVVCSPGYYEILWVWLWTVAYRCHSDGDCMFYSLCDLMMCMDDMFSAWFGSFYNFILFGFIWWISASFAWLDDVTTFGQDRSMFLKLVFHRRFSWWFVLENVWWCRIWCMNAFIHISREPAIVQSFLRDNKSQYLHVSSVLVVKRVAVTFVEVSLCFGFLLLADANNADRTLCKYL